MRIDMRKVEMLREAGGGRYGPPHAYDESKVLQGLYKLGDFHTKSSRHHGTPKERLAAFLEGFDDISDSPVVACKNGLRYIENLP